LGLCIAACVAELVNDLNTRSTLPSHSVVRSAANHCEGNWWTKKKFLGL